MGEPSPLLPSPTPLWQAPWQDVVEARADLDATAGQLTGPWKLLLLGDGSPTRHLQLLTGQPVQVELIAMAPEPPSRRGRRRRRRWRSWRLPCCAVRCGCAAAPRPSPGRELVEPGGGRVPPAGPQPADLAQPHQQPGRTLPRGGWPGRVGAPWLEQRFGQAGPFWSRHYRFFRGGAELTVIREVFSPLLERWLGPTTHPADLKGFVSLAHNTF